VNFEQAFFTLVTSTLYYKIKGEFGFCLYLSTSELPGSHNEFSSNNDMNFSTCGSETHSRHGYVSSFFCVVLSCVGRGLVSGRSPVQGVLPTVQEIHKFQKINSELE
jgi:hypothetical protein